MKRVLLIGVAALLLSAASAPAQTIVIVRHAERADDGAQAPMMGKDPDLSAAGRARAAALASVLKDAHISAIYVSEYRRTRQTAEPLARAIDVKPNVIAAKDVPALVEALRTAQGNVLVVGHSDTIPEIIEALGVKGPSKIGESDYDSLFIVTAAPRPTLLRLHYR
jgi:broad specificity phosphatase PhoE